jgi:hypothetical protein
MAEPETKTKEDELTPAELATYGISPKQPDEPKVIKGQEPETENTNDTQ